MTNVYVDTAVVRIQQYLSRTPTLRGYRSGSAAIKAATAAAVVDPVVAGLAEVNPEAGEADGVVSVWFAASSPPDPAADEAMVRQVQDRLLTHLREHLPAAHLTSVHGYGENYLEAVHQQIKARRAAGEARVDLPPVFEFQAVTRCDVCHTDPAVRWHRVMGDRQRLCQDCTVRNVSLAQTRKQPTDPDPDLARTAEQELRHRLDEDRAPGAGLADPPDTFDELARLGSSGSGRNHLATVFADGNAVGAFFDALATATDPQMQSRKKKVSADLNEATQQALAQATGAVLGDRNILSVVPHVAGGDDLMVTLPAEHAWRFTLTYLSAFAEWMDVAASDLLDTVNAGRAIPLAPISASAGIVISDSSYPFTLVVDAAARMLRQAKRHTRGRTPAVQWLDITTDGHDPAHEPADLAQLRVAAPHLDRLAGVPQAHRNAVGVAHTQAGALTAHTVARRVGDHRLAIEAFLPAGANLDQPEPAGMPLPTALNLVRWWPPS
ncbi:hypothetical protein ACFO6V_07120 [Promicromonospora alba]|uniref:Cas10/Cmr2 second palm domain-containing protein n=1 Tax=Promicromonospora alba TaxID=1616110 RepID=A0ABV9HEF5_9MICO